jgi:ABC-type glycerol-3-phosphate transport system substrate-binding protein
MKSPRRYTALAATAIAAALALTACSSGDDKAAGPTSSGTSTAGGDQHEAVTITVAGLLPGTKQDAIDALNTEVSNFEAKYPWITVKAKDYEWKDTTFASQLAGGTLPDVFEIPFTDGKTLIENKQIADIDAQFQTLPYASQFNANVLDAGKGTDGHVYAIPAKSVYGVGLHYNRDLFTKAGLDPNKPPTTWDEVRADAKQIAQKVPGVAGYMQMTKSATGGWQLTTATYSRGGRMESVADDGKVTATLDNDATKASLQYLHDLRWTDNSMGANFLFDWGSINQAFAAGKIGMYTSGSDVYTSLVQTNGLKAETYGLTAIPLEGSDAGVLGGGTLAAVSVKATDAQKDAAVKWIDAHYLAKLTNQDAAVADAKLQQANNQPVGTPTFPIFGKDLYLENQTWIKDYINAPLDQMTGYTDKMFDFPMVDEPRYSTQDLYSALDPVVQAVLTDKNANIDNLLKQANSKVQTILDKNQG